MAGNIRFVIDRIGDEQARQRGAEFLQLFKKRPAITFVDNVRVARDCDDIIRRQRVRVLDGGAVHQHANGVGVEKFAQIARKRRFLVLLEQYSFI